jgi:Fur family peroxide stress response transcriptional regulator
MNQDAYDRLVSCGVRPSMQRLAIMDYLLTHRTHPTVEEVYQGICKEIHTLSRTTVYNTLRLFSEHNAARMITIDEHRVCYDGDVSPHVHFYCRNCGRVYDLFDEEAPQLAKSKQIEGHVIDEMQLYYKGICKDCKSHLS